MLGGGQTEAIVSGRLGVEPVLPEFVQAPTAVDTAESQNVFSTRFVPLGKRSLNEERALRFFLVDEKVGTVAAITPVLIDAFLASRPRSRARSYNLLLSTAIILWTCFARLSGQ